MSIASTTNTFNPVTDDVISVTNEKTGEVATVYPNVDLSESSNWEMGVAPHRARMYLTELVDKLCPYFGLTANQVPAPKVMRWMDKWRVVHSVLQCTVGGCFSIVISTANIYTFRVSDDTKHNHEN